VSPAAMVVAVGSQDGPRGRRREARESIEDPRCDDNANRLSLQWITTHQPQSAQRLDHQTVPLTEAGQTDTD